MDSDRGREHRESTDFKVLCSAFGASVFAPPGNMILLQEGLDPFLVPFDGANAPTSEPKIKVSNRWLSTISPSSIGLRFTY
jgi:hypothetical protein